MAEYTVGQKVRDVIGTGMRTPFSFSVGRGIRAVSVSNGIEKIQSAIRDILLTRPGERVMQPEYGSRLFDLVFEMGDAITTELLYEYTVTALRRWEPRIRVTTVSFSEDVSRPGYIGIQIGFVVRATHETGSYVFPFEKKAASMSETVTGSESGRLSVQGSVAPIRGYTPLLSGS